MGGDHDQDGWEPEDEGEEDERNDLWGLMDDRNNDWRKKSVSRVRE